MTYALSPHRGLTAVATVALTCVAVGYGASGGSTSDARGGDRPARTAQAPAAPRFSMPTTIDNRYLPLTAHRR